MKLNINQLTFRKVSRSPFLASILSLSMFPNGMSGKIFFGPLTPETQFTDKKILDVGSSTKYQTNRIVSAIANNSKANPGLHVPLKSD